MTSVIDQLEEIVDWLDPRASESSPVDLFLAGRLDRLEPSLTRWIAERSATDAEHLSRGPDTFAANLALLVRLAGDSASEATQVRSRLVAHAWRTAAEAHGWDWLEFEDELAVGFALPPRDAGQRGRDGRWAVVPVASHPTVLILGASAGVTGAVWREQDVAAGLPRQELIGLEGLELIDLSALADADAVQLADEDALATSVATAALGDVLDAAIDLGITLGFLRRIGDYVRQRSLVDEDPTSLEQSLLERLGTAYAELGVVSEALRETVAAAPVSALPALRQAETWSERAAHNRAFSVPVHERLLSDLFEVAGASATSGRLELDRGWRDFTARQAVFPLRPAANLASPNNKEIVMADRELHLALNTFPVGTHPAAWRRENGDTRGPIDLDRYQEIARVAERGLLDAIFFADALTVGGTPAFEPCWFLEPTVLIAALAQVTEDLGFVASYSTTYSHPYNVARLFASLDHVTGGRVGWNVVTSYDERAAPNFGDAELPDKELRYRRAEEFVEVVKALWDSWEEGAVLADKENGVLIDYERVNAIDHVGEFFAVAGPLQVPRSPQGQPLVVQAGGSPAGRDLAARQANAIFSAQLDLDAAIAYRDDIHARAERFGRSGEEIVVMPGLSVIVGSTDAEAHSIREELDEIGGVPDVHTQLLRFAHFVNVDPEKLSLDAPVPVGLVSEVSKKGTPQGFRDAIQSVITNPTLTLREALSRGVGHRLVVGGPETVADDIEHWFLAGGADGFNLMAESYPDGLERFVDYVVPLLQDKGIYRRSYETRLLNERFGVQVGASRVGARA